MFSNTAYEALYQYLGLALHSQFIEIITSEGFFKAVVLLIFGVLFFTTAVKFLSRYVPGSLMARRHVPLSSFVKIIACLFLGLALLRIGSTTSVKSYSGRYWSNNPYVKSRFGEVKDKIKVSFVFDLLSRTAEETSALLNRIVDNLMSRSHSQLGAPNFFYKSIMYSASATIDSPEIKEMVHFYTEECFQKVLPHIGQGFESGNLAEFFNPNGNDDQKLSEIDIKTQDSGNYTCLDVKNEARAALKQHAKNHHVNFLRVTGGKVPRVVEGDEAWQNMHMANMLVNHYLDGKESVMGIMFALYASVLLWAPLWTLFYHIMTSMDYSVEMMRSIGELSDGISLYGSRLISSRIYYFYSIYSWVQIMIAILTTGGMFYFLRPMLTENEGEKAPEFLGGASDTASTVGTVASTGSKVIGAL